MPGSPCRWPRGDLMGISADGALDFRNPGRRFPEFRLQIPQICGMDALNLSYGTAEPAVWIA